MPDRLGPYDDKRRFDRTPEPPGEAAVPAPAAPGAATWAAPMLATASDLGAFAGEPPDRWRFERKLDGLRCIAVRNGSRVELWSRNRLPFTERFPHVLDALRALAPDTFTFDGELVAVGEGDRSAFGALQAPGGSAGAVLHLFDLISLLGRDTTGLPLADRQALLAQAVGQRPPPGLAVVAPEPGDPASLLDRACREGWEGLVAKRLDAAYRGGRSPAWRKLKCVARQEFVIGGFTEPTGARSGFGALLVGYHDASGLRYAGKVGTGFDDATLTALHRRLLALEVPAPPFVDADVARGTHWVVPELVCDVRFAEWTPDGRLRHPSFVGLRADKTAAEVVRETPGLAPATRRGRSGRR